jgi:hypothetical protein
MAPLPGPDVFKGLGALFGKGNAALPGPNVFPPFAPRGMRAFFTQAPKTVFPGPNVFQKFMGGRPCPSRNPAPCPCKAVSKMLRRGMGQSGDIDYDPDSLFTTTGISASPYGADTSQGGATQDLSLVTPLPTWDANQEAVSTLGNPSTVAAYNPLLSPTQNTLISNATSAQQATALANQLQAQNTVAQAAANQPTSTAAPSTSSLNTYLSQSTILSGYSNGMVLAGAGVLGVVAISLMNSKKKGKR